MTSLAKACAAIAVLSWSTIAPAHSAMAFGSKTAEASVGWKQPSPQETLELLPAPSGIGMASFYDLSAPLPVAAFAGAASSPVPLTAPSTDATSLQESAKTPVPTSAVMLVSGVLVLASLLRRSREVVRRSTFPSPASV